MTEPVELTGPNVITLITTHFTEIKAKWVEMIKEDPSATLGEAALAWAAEQGLKLKATAPMMEGLFPDISNINALAGAVNTLIANWRSEGTIDINIKIKLPAPTA